jgi:hypothetical protein
MEKPTVSTRMSPGSNPGWCTNECVNADKLKQHQPNDWVDNGN